MSAPNGGADRSTGDSGWGCLLVLFGTIVIGVVAPVVLVIALVESWSTAAVVIAAVVTAVFWGGLILLRGPGKRYLSRSERAGLATELPQVRELAAARGLSYADERPGLADTLNRLTGNSETRCTHVLYGPAGRYPTVLAWCECQVGSVHTTNLIAALALPRELPYLSVLSALAQSVTPGLRGDRQQFENADFNDAYQVRTHAVGEEGRRYASAVVTPPGMQAILAARVPGLTVTDGAAVLEWGGYFDARSAVAALDRIAAVVQLLDAIPAFVWEQYGRDRRPLPGLDPDH